MRALVDSVDIHLLPCLNPDGEAAQTRENAAELDLNREFPGWEDRGLGRAELTAGRPREVRILLWFCCSNVGLQVAAAVRWVLDNPFLLRQPSHTVQYPKPFNRVVSCHCLFPCPAKFR